MKKYILIGLTICSNYIIAQQKLDTIYANDKKNVALFFPNQIRQGITGMENYVFTYNREKEQYFGLLQATPGTESNLLAITNDGQVYAYILKYADTLKKLNYFIQKSESIGNEKPETIESAELEEVNKKDDNINLYYRRYSEYLLKSKLYTMTTKRKHGMVLKLLKAAYNKDEVYLVMEIKNRSGIDFEVDYLNVYTMNGNKRVKSSYQRLEQEVIYKHDMPKIIKNRQSSEFVYVLLKFVLGDNEKLLIEVKELKGSRIITMKSNL
uniref:Conserved protein found in conjugate transposon n=1 Tax=uncultured Flavobacteriaceae bacterium TaxID=165436 RepID=Q2YZD7_9FLAO|nr:conserved protein found in conjugate transposon [uncultured Flavobacteriaceae bacterium]